MEIGFNAIIITNGNDELNLVFDKKIAHLLNMNLYVYKKKSVLLSSLERVKQLAFFFMSLMQKDFVILFFNNRYSS
jgi:hypothetical protein